MSGSQEVKSSVPKDPPSNAGIKSKTLKSDVVRSKNAGIKSKTWRSNVVRSKNSLAWYVAFNAKPREENSCIPQIKWKCPPKFTLAVDWLVAAGEGSQEAEVQKHREATVVEAVYSHVSAIPPSPLVSPDIGGESHDNSQIAQIPIIPIEEIEERAGEIPPHLSADSSPVNNTEINPQTPDAPKSPSISANHIIPSCNPSTSQNPPVNDESLMGMLRGLESGDVAVAAAAAATVAAVMESKAQIDTELLIKFITNPEMIKKLINENGCRAGPESGSISAPQPSTPLPLPSSTPISVPEPKTLLPLPNLGSLFVANKLTNECGQPSCQAIASVSSVESVPQSHAQPSTKVRMAGDESARKQVTTNARSALVYTADPVKVSLQFPISNSDKSLTRNLCNEPGGPVHAHIHQVRPPISTTMIFNNNEDGKRMIKKYGAPCLPGITPMNPSTSKPNTEMLNKMINVYGARDAAGIRPGVSLIPLNMGEIEKRYRDRDAPGIRPAVSLIPSSMEEMEKRYGAHGAPGMIRPVVSTIPSNMEEMEKRYGTRDAPGIKPMAPPIPCTFWPNMAEMKNMMNGHGASGPKPLLGAYPTPVRTDMVAERNPYASVNSFESKFASSGMFPSTPFRPLSISAPPPLKDFNYYKSFIEQHGEKRHENEHKLPNFGQGGDNQLQGLKFAQNMTPTQLDHANYQRPFVYSNSHMGYHNPPYQHTMTSNQFRGGEMMEVPAAKRMRFCESTWNSPCNWQ